MTILFTKNKHCPLLIIAVFLSFLSFCLSANQVDKKTPSSRDEQKRPNIIFVMADDQRDNTFSAAGHPQLKTPSLDWLVNNGVRFSNTYAAAPVCAPSRVSFLTGMYERKHGIGFGSAYQLTEQQWSHSYPALMQKNGYSTAFIGKIGMEYYTFKNKITTKFDYWYGHNGWTKFFPKKYPNKYQTKPYLTADKDIITEIMSDGIDDYLTNKAPSDKPFILSVSLSTPHGSQARSMGSRTFNQAPSAEYKELENHAIYGDLFRDGSVQAHQDTGQDPYQYLPKYVMDHDKGRRNKSYDYYYNKETNKEAHIRYYQMITGIDKLMGEMISTLKKNNQLANTVIIFSSDHGLHMGENGFGGKSLLSDIASKVPFLLYDPRLPKNKRGLNINKLVSTLDITSTLLAYSKTTESEHMQGMSVLPLIEENKTPWRKDIYLESLMSFRDNPIQEGVRQGDWKYIRFFRGTKYKNRFQGMAKSKQDYRMVYKETDLDFSGQKPLYEVLYNLKEDPQEKVNLIEKMKASTILKKLREKTADYSVQQMSERRDFIKQVDVQLRSKI